MKEKIILLLMAFAMTLPGLTATDATAAEIIIIREPVIIRDLKMEVIRTADNFIVMYDSSSSMKGQYKGTGMRKIEALKKILKEKVEKLPELSWKAGLYSFAVRAGSLEQTLTPYYDMKPYNKAEFAKAIDQLPTKAIGPPLIQRALHELDGILAGLSGRTVVFIFSDGKYTTTGERKRPVDMARELADKYNVCFYIISHAVGAVQKDLLKAVASINECSRVIPFDFVLERPEYFTGALFVIEKKVIERLENRIKIVGVKIDDILFDFGRADVKPQFTGELDELGNFLRETPGSYVVLMGFTDGTGSTEYNLGLSRRRAESVGNYLIQEYNIDAARIVKLWYGTGYPVASNDSYDGRRQNRRVVSILAGLD